MCSPSWWNSRLFRVRLPPKEKVLIETMLFFHPVVWWMSAVVRRERENCCDDIAVKVCSDRAVYAKTLVVLDDSGALGVVDLATFAEGAFADVPWSGAPGKEHITDVEVVDVSKQTPSDDVRFGAVVVLAARNREKLQSLRAALRTNPRNDAAAWLKLENDLMRITSESDEPSPGSDAAKIFDIKDANMRR